MALRVNVGCGEDAVPGWRNFDNSFSVRVAQVPLLPNVLRKMGLMDNAQYAFSQTAHRLGLEYADATRGLRLESGSVDVLYSSHMMEHLDKTEASDFLREAMRVLQPGGIIRIAVPDLARQARQYSESGDAEAFLAGTILSVPRPRTLLERLHVFLVGTRHHQWMYDGLSLSRLLQEQGFVNAEVLPAGRTKIQDPAPLDLHERSSESVYVEAEKPRA